MIRLDPHRYDGFKDLYFNAVYKLLCEMEISENLHFPGLTYSAAPGLVWYLCDYDLYSCLTGEKSGFEDICPPNQSEVRDMKEDELKDALRPLILGKVEILREARKLLRVPEKDENGRKVKCYKGCHNYSLEIQVALSKYKLMYDAEKKELCAASPSDPDLLDFIPYEDEKTVRSDLEKLKEELDAGYRELFMLLNLEFPGMISNYIDVFHDKNGSNP